MTRLPISNPIQRAQDACRSLPANVKCPVCSSSYQQVKPWRSRACEHSFCESCKAFVLGQVDNSKLTSINIGKCPIPNCEVPLRPADVVEDVTVAAILDACVALVQWSQDNR